MDYYKKEFNFDDFTKLKIKNKFQSVVYSFIFLLFDERVDEENVELYYENLESFFLEKNIKNNEKLEFLFEKHIKELNYEIIYLKNENKVKESNNFLKNYYFQINENEVFPLFSKNIFPEISIKSTIFNFKNYKYIDLYIEERLLNKYKTLSINNFLHKISESKNIFYIINDVFNIGIVILDEKMKFKTLYDDVDNEDFIILQKKNNFYYPVVLILGDDKKYIISKKDNVYDEILNTEYEENYNDYDNSSYDKSLSVEY